VIVCERCKTENPDQTQFCLQCLTALQGQAPLKRTADIVVCFDTTGSMADDIEDMKSHAVKFAKQLAEEARVNFQLGLIEFRDLDVDGTLEVVAPLSPSTLEFHNRVQALEVGGGGDEPESSIDAVFKALEMDGYRGGDVRKYVIVVTDASPKVPDKQGRSVDDLVAALMQAQARIMLVVPENVEPYKKIKQSLGGRAELIPIVDASGKRMDFEVVLKRIVEGTKKE